MTIKEIEQYLQKKNEFFSSDVIREIEQSRMTAIQEKDEEKANHYWCLAVIYYVQSGYLTLYHNVRNRRYTQAYEAMKQTDMQLVTLGKNFDIGDEENDPYHLVFIRSMLQEYEKIFPYEYFICREQVIKEQKCSICGQVVKLRGGCNHVPGKIYMGEVCMHEITDFTYLGMKAARDPFDKYEYLEPYQSEKMPYNFGILEGLMESLKSPYEYWEVEVVKAKNPEFARVGRNDKCPCGSGKKFKHCCMNDEEKMYFDHYKIKLLNDPDEKVDKSLTILS